MEILNTGKRQTSKLFGGGATKFNQRTEVLTGVDYRLSVNILKSTYLVQQLVSI